MSKTSANQAFPDDVTKAISAALTILRDVKDRLFYNRENKTYHLDGKPLTSVTSLVSQFSRFDPERMAISCSYSPKSEYFGMPAKDILACWNRKAQASKGIHLYSEERCFKRKGGRSELDDILPGNRHLHPYWLSSPSRKPLEPAKKALKEWSRSQDENRYFSASKEFFVADGRLGFVGKVDLLRYDRERKAFCIVDYKSCRDMHAPVKNRMRTPFNMLRDNAAGYASLQLSLYAVALEDMGIPVCDMKVIWTKKDGTYEEVTVTDCREEIRSSLTDGLKKLNDARVPTMITRPMIDHFILLAMTFGLGGRAKELIGEVQKTFARLHPSDNGQTISLKMDIPRGSINELRKFYRIAGRPCSIENCSMTLKNYPWNDTGSYRLEMSNSPNCAKVEIVNPAGWHTVFTSEKAGDGHNDEAQEWFLETILSEALQKVRKMSDGRTAKGLQRA